MKDIFIFLSLLCFSGTHAQHFNQHILFLASDSLQGRAPASRGETLAASYIAAVFDSSGCHTVFQKFPFGKDIATNVIGLKNMGKDSTVIVSAHYDHLGVGSNKSREVIRKGIHHGADDNASGVAMMLEVAKWIAAGGNRSYNFVFVAYSAHEAGLFGSAHFSQSAYCDSLKIKAVINFDMVGRLDTTSKTLRVSFNTADSIFTRFFENENDRQLHFRLDDSNIPFTDVKSFAEKKIPVLSITTGIHNDYHRISDTEDKINYPGMKIISRVILKFLNSLN